MKTRSGIGILGAVCWMAASGTASGQFFNSGSTGADGAYNPACAPIPCIVTETLPPSGVYHYTTVTIPVGVTVRYVRNAANTPVTVLATGDVTINGAINLTGGDGLNSQVSGTSPRPGAPGGPGGFDGGNSAVGTVIATDGKGPGGGAPHTGGIYGAPGGFVTLMPLFGGSGGGGGRTGSGWAVGASGGGGGGAILIASSTAVRVFGAITANGGSLSGGDSFCSVCSGSGSGGAIRLVASEITGSGSLSAMGGPSSGFTGPGGGVGRIRLEAFSLGFAGSATPAPSPSISPGPVTASSAPALVNLPTLAIASVGGVAAPSVPGGAYSAADVTLPLGTTNPVPVVITATNTPVGSPTAIALKLIVQTGAPATIAIPGANHAGTFASSTATANVTFPVGQLSVVQAWATMTLTGQIAGLFPLIDGEPVERMQVAAVQGAPSTLSLVTNSGKEVRVDQLPFEDQLRVAQAWEVLRATRVE